MMAHATYMLTVRGTQIAGNVADANSLAETLRDSHNAAERADAPGGVPPFDLTVGANDDTQSVTVSRRGTPGAEAMFTHTHLPTSGTATDAKMFMKGADHQAIDGWSSDKFTYSADDAPTEEVTVYSNIGSPRNLRIGALQADAVLGAASQSTGTVTINLPDVGKAVMANSIVIPGTTVFPAVPGTQNTEIVQYVLDSDGNTEGNQTVGAYDGTFYGVSGEYRCSGTCSASRDADGMAVLAGTWTFVPDGDNPEDAVLNAALDDDDYLTFGYWLQTTAATETDPAMYAVQTFSQGSMPYGDVSDVLGSATYMGKAGGLYTHEETPAELRGQDAEDVTTGSFSADVTLNATFAGMGSTAPEDRFMISGTVTDFTNDAGRVFDGWTVTLQDAPLNPAGASTGSFSGMTEGHAAADDGEWIGTFYGPNGGTDSHPTPTGVAGEFNAHFTDGNVVGAYGATLQ